jgi:hypothetical protein
MGLLRKAVSVTPPPSRGLLKRSLKALSLPPQAPVLLTQAELDALLANRKAPPAPVFGRSRGEPARVPKTWDELGVDAPPERGPLIDSGEFERLFGGGKTRPAAPAAAEAAASAIPVPAPSRPAASPAASTLQAADPQAVALSASAQINAAPRNAQFPSRAFSILQAALGISKGALLLYDPLRMVYAPWASIGYDTTTLRRLRIPLGAADSFNAAANGEPLTVSGESMLKQYQPYFSSREGGQLTRIILSPFVSQTRLAGLLMVTEASGAFAEESDLLACLSEIGRSAAEAVQKAREERLAGMPAPAPSRREPGGIADELPQILASPRLTGRRVLLVSVTLKEYLAAVVASNPYMESFRLEEDMRAFMECFISDLGRMIQTEPGAFLMAVQDLERRDIDLFLHQLLTFLRAQFGEPDGGLALREAAIKRTRSFPDEEPSIPALVSFFSS